MRNKWIGETKEKMKRIPNEKCGTEFGLVIREGDWKRRIKDRGKGKETPANEKETKPERANDRRKLAETDGREGRDGERGQGRGGARQNRKTCTTGPAEFV